MSTHRGSIFLEDAGVLSHTSFKGEQFVLRLHAPKAAAAATPGSFVHIRCGPTVPMRRPLSIMRTDAGEGWLELLYRPVGAGLLRLTQAAPGDTLSVLAPIGNGFTLDLSRPRVIAIGGGVGIPPMLFLAEELMRQADCEPWVLMGSEVPFPFDLVPAVLAAERAGNGARWQQARALESLESAGVPSLTATNAELDGVSKGYVTDIARQLLEDMTETDRARTQIAACGPGPMLRATAKLARAFELPCQIALEEYMACGVGGCAGCTVPVHTGDQVAMKRVCVDGPVFEAREIYPAA